MKKCHSLESLFCLLRGNVRSILMYTLVNFLSRSVEIMC